jgi:carbonic anhydrase
LRKPLLEDDQLLHDFAERGSYDEQTLAALPVSSPAETVRADVERLLAAPQISTHTRVSGHVYDVNTGLITSVVDSTRWRAALPNLNTAALSVTEQSGRAAAVTGIGVGE